jgi:predicted tellurium resistance membrane protein TerC
MGNRPAAYWILLIVGIGMAVAGFVVRSSPDPQKHAMAQYLGWGAIAFLLIARFFFRRKPDTTSPMPRD